MFEEMDEFHNCTYSSQQNIKLSIPITSEYKESTLNNILSNKSISHFHMVFHMVFIK